MLDIYKESWYLLVYGYFFLPASSKEAPVIISHRNPVCKAKVGVLSMVINAEEVEGIAVLYLCGDLDSQACREVREIAGGLIADGRRSLVVDLSGVQRIYTTGVFVLLDLQRTAASGGWRLVCCAARPFVRELLRMTMLDRALQLQGDLETALDLTWDAS